MQRNNFCEDLMMIVTVIVYFMSQSFQSSSLSAKKTLHFCEIQRVRLIMINSVSGQKSYSTSIWIQEPVEQFYLPIWINNNNKKKYWEADVIIFGSVHSGFNGLCALQYAKVWLNELSHPGCFVCKSHYHWHWCTCYLLKYRLTLSHDSFECDCLAGVFNTTFTLKHRDLFKTVWINTCLPVFKWSV